MTRKAVLFDMDGTLLDTLRDLRDAVNHTMRGFGYPKISLEQARRYVGNGVNRLVELSLPGGASNPRLKEAIADFRAYYSTHDEIETKPYPGIGEMLSALKRAGIPMGVVSNKPEASVKTLTEKFFPELTISAGENEAAGIRRKPAPDMVTASLEKLGVAASECVYVGDSEVDLMTAKAAGVPCISVLWGFRTKEELEEAGASRFASTPDEVFRMITGVEM